MAGRSITRKRGEGKALWLLGGLYEVKLAGEETDGALTVMEMTIPAGMGPPPHTHPGDESVYVLEGTVRYQIGEETIEGGPGSFFHVPEGIWENFQPTTDARLLVFYRPGGIDRFFAEAGEPAQAREVPPPAAAPPDFERIVAIGERHGMAFKAPVVT